ncbi:MAG: hypothetical protein LC130_20030 [Bryobacterales bacterium]|nr:hypothetical protein [Bryobacterales bacterium]
MGVVQKGPVHPLFFDPRYRPEHSHGRQFKSDLGWTPPWGPDLTIRQFSEMERLWAAGVADLWQVVANATPECRREAVRELGVAKTLLAQIRSVIHIARFYALRERLTDAPDKTLAASLVNEMAAIAEQELRNARDALPAVCADSRLGYANSGNNDQIGVPRAGVYSAASIEKKITQLVRLLQEEIPACRRTHGLANPKKNTEPIQ